MQGGGLILEAYRVGITIGLTNHVSSILSLIARDLAKTDAAAVKLQRTLHTLKLTGMAGLALGGMGLGIMEMFKGSYEAAKKYETALLGFKNLRLDDAINQDANTFAQSTKMMGVSATELITTLTDMHTVLGNYGMARQIAPVMAEMIFANKALYGKEENRRQFDENQAQMLAKVVELRGGWKSPEEFRAQADLMQHVISGTAGRVMPSDYRLALSTGAAYAKQMKPENFFYQLEPLIQELGGNRVGTGLMTSYNRAIQGMGISMTAAQEFLRLGLTDPALMKYTKTGKPSGFKPGAFKYEEQFYDPIRMLDEVLLPKMAKAGITDPKKITNELFTLFGRTGGLMWSTIFQQEEKIKQNMGVNRQAGGLDNTLSLAKGSPTGAEAALHAAWENLKIQSGEAILPIIVPALNALANAIQNLAQVARLHPQMTKLVIQSILAFGALSLVGGGILLLVTALKGLKLVLWDLPKVIARAAAGSAAAAAGGGVPGAPGGGAAGGGFWSNLLKAGTMFSVGQAVGDYIKTHQKETPFLQTPKGPYTPGMTAGQFIAGGNRPGGSGQPGVPIMATFEALKRLVTEAGKPADALKNLATAAVQPVSPLQKLSGTLPFIGSAASTAAAGLDSMGAAIGRLMGAVARGAGGGGTSQEGKVIPIPGKQSDAGLHHHVVAALERIANRPMVLTVNGRVLGDVAMGRLDHEAGRTTTGRDGVDSRATLVPAGAGNFFG